MYMKVFVILVLLSLLIQANNSESAYVNLKNQPLTKKQLDTYSSDRMRLADERMYALLKRKNIKLKFQNELKKKKILEKAMYIYHRFG